MLNQKPNQNKKPSLYLYALPAIIISAFLALSLVFAWTEPTTAPPAGNAEAPLNVGNVGQSKVGGLILNTGGAIIGLIVEKGELQLPATKIENIGGVNITSGIIKLGLTDIHTFGTRNFFAGQLAGNQTMDGYNNIGIGTSALVSNTSGYDNIGIGGIGVFQHNTTGYQNIAVGSATLTLNTTGSDNIAIGDSALNLNTTGSSNIAVGTSALLSNTTGNNNTALGHQAGFSSSGSSNVFLGYQAGFNATGGSKLYIANSNTTPPLIYGDFSSGRVGLGTITPEYKLDVVGAFRLQPSSAPTGANGVIYYDSGTNKFRCYQNGAWTDCIGAGSGLPSGTSGQTLRHDGTTWVANNVLYNNGTNVGIGTTTLGAKLHVNAGGVVGLRIDSASDDIQMMTQENHVIRFDTVASNSTGLSFWNNFGGTVMQLSGNGKVGIGTASPAERLQIAGNVNINNNLFVRGGSGLGGSPAIALAIGDNDTGLYWISDGNLAVYTNNAERMRITSAGNVGIGTTNPGYTLTVINNNNTQGSAISATSAFAPPAGTNSTGVAGYSYDTIAAGAIGRAWKDSAGANIWRMGVNGSVQTPGDYNFAGYFQGKVAVVNSSAGAGDGRVGIGIENPEYKLHVVNGEPSQNSAVYARSTFGPQGAQDNWSIGIGAENYDESAVGALGSAYYEPTGGKTWRMGIYGNVQTSGDHDYAGYFSGKVLISPMGAGVPATTPWDLTVNGSAAKPGGGSWTSTSDIRLKKNVTTVDNALERMLQLRGVEFEWDEPETAKILPGVQMGMVAQEVEKVFPQWVSAGKDGYKDLTFRGFEALTVEAIKGLKAENDLLKLKNQELEDRIGALEIKINSK